MKTLVCVILVIGIAIGSFTLGWYTSNQGYRVVDSNGSAIVKGNAAQIVKDENAKLQRQLVGMPENEAQDYLQKNNRTMFVGVRDGKQQEYKGQKTFTNLTVEVNGNLVTKVLGWY